MIAALAFVPKGVAKQFPERDEPDAAEIEVLKRDALATGALENDDEDDDDSDWNTDSDDEAAAVQHALAMAASMSTDNAGASAASTSKHLEEAMKKLDMDNYDNDDDNLVNRMLQGQSTEYDGDDPYITLKEDGDSDAEDDTIKPSDLLILAAKTEEESASLEVWIFEEATEDGDINAYVHHDIMLPAFPLSVAWCGFNPNDPDVPGNFVAVSTFDPEIEIWNLDVMDAMSPVQTLGGTDSTAKPEDGKKKKSKKGASKASLRAGSHTDSVLCLAWNATFQNVLASGSADKTIKIWDLAKGTCEQTLKHHSDKVQALAWNPVDAPILLSGSFDKTAAITDMRTPGAPSVAWQLSADAEALVWNPHTPTQFTVALEDGSVLCLDARGGAGSKPLYRLAAHNKPTTSLCYNPAVPDLLATASTDKTVKLWDVSDNVPKLLCTEDLKAGAVFCIGFPAESPHLLAAGGSKGSVSVWDILQRADVAKKYGRRLSRFTAGKSIVKKAVTDEDEEMDTDV